MQDTEPGPTAEASPPPRKARSWLVGVAILALVGFGIWLTIQGGEISTDAVQDVATAMRNDDMALLEQATGGADIGFLEWLTALRAEPEFTNCTEATVGTAKEVTCDVTFGEEFFYSQVLGEQLTSRIIGKVGQDGLFVGNHLDQFGSMNVEDDLREWVQANRPELEDKMYGSPGYLGNKETRESAELRMELFDDFMASR